MKSIVAYCGLLRQNALFGVCPEYVPMMFVCQIFTAAPASGLQLPSTTLSASRTGSPVQPSETSSRTRSVAVVHGPSVVVATMRQLVSPPVNGSGYDALSVIDFVPPVAQSFTPPVSAPSGGEVGASMSVVVSALSPHA